MQAHGAYTSHLGYLVLGLLMVSMPAHAIQGTATQKDAEVAHTYLDGIYSSPAMESCAKRGNLHGSAEFVQYYDYVEKLLALSLISEARSEEIVNIIHGACDFLNKKITPLCLHYGIDLTEETRRLIQSELCRK